MATTVRCAEELFTIPLFLVPVLMILEDTKTIFIRDFKYFVSMSHDFSIGKQQT